MTETIESMPTRTDQLQFAQALVKQARSEGVELIGVRACRPSATSAADPICFRPGSDTGQRVRCRQTR